MGDWQIQQHSIPARCRTNLDDYRHEEWPCWFTAVPRKGEWVASRDGNRLCVCGVTHRQVSSGDGVVAMIEVELTKG